jgi:mannitol-specific phosphotransferase system IIBC component
MASILSDTAIYILLPVLLGSLAGVLFWRKRRVLIGNAIGSGVIAAIMVLFILQRLGEFMANPQPGQSPTIAMIVLAGLGWLDVFILFFVSGFVEDRVAKNRAIRPDDF